MRMALAVTFAVVAASVAGCAASSADNAATGPVESKPVATISSAAVSQPPPCSAAVSDWDAISLPFEPAPASAENSVAQTMLKLRKATKAGNELLVETLGKRLAKNSLAVLHHDLPPRCAPDLRRDVRRQMTFAGLAGVGMSLGNFSTATGAMKLAVAYQRQVMAEEDKITGSNNGGW
jgi:hypothetical protein